MNRYALVAVGVFLAGGLAFSIVGHVTSASAHQVEHRDDHGHNHKDQQSEEMRLLQEENRMLAAEFARMENTRNQLAEAEKKTASERRLLQLHGQEKWTELVAAKKETFLNLRQEAALSAKTVQCCICDGTGRMSACTLCNNDGKCLACGGKGTKQFGEVCGACTGSGKCYLCLGTGKLECLFCNDGEISADTPLPPTRMPVGF